MTLYIVFLQTVKKVESYEQINIQSIILSEAPCAKEERTDSSHVPYYSKRQGFTVQL